MLIEYLIVNGSDDALDEINRNIFKIKMLEKFINPTSTEKSLLGVCVLIK